MPFSTARYLTRAALLTFSCWGSVQAGIIDTAGDIQPINAPASVLEGSVQSNFRARIFLESSMLLPGRQNVDINQAGSWSDDSTFPQGFIPRNTPVYSYYLFSDPIGGNRNYYGQVTFDTPVLGIIVRNNRLNNTQYLGASGTLYPSENRAIDFGQEDTVVLSEDLKTVLIDWRTSGGQDSIRILTAVPEPGSFALLAAGLVGVTVAARRRKSA